MKNSFLLILFLVATTYVVNAQDIYITPTPPIMKQAHIDEPLILDIGTIKAEGEIVNNSGQNLQLTWTRTINDLNGDFWRTRICDKTQCWDTTVDSESFSSPAGSIDPLQVYFDIYDLEEFNNHPGNGMVQVCVVADSDPNINVCGDFYAEGFAVGIDDVEGAAATQLYPNPVQNQLNVVINPAYQIEKAEIYNLLGSKVGDYTIRFDSTMEIDASNLPEGMYFLNLYDTNNQIVTTRAFSKVN